MPNLLWIQSRSLIQTKFIGWWCQNDIKVNELVLVNKQNNRKKIGKSEGSLLITLILFDHCLYLEANWRDLKFYTRFLIDKQTKVPSTFPISGVQVSENGYRHLWKEEKILTVNLAMSTKAPIYMTVDIGESHCPGDK